MHGIYQYSQSPFPEALERDLTPFIPISSQLIEIILIFLVIAPISALIGWLVGLKFNPHTHKKNRVVDK